TDGALPYQLLGFLEDDRTRMLAAHLEHAGGLLLAVDHVLAFAQLLHHRLFAIPVFAGLHGVQAHLPVPVVGRGDDYGVHVRPRQLLTIIASGEDLIAPELFGAGQAALVDIADRD